MKVMKRKIMRVVRNLLAGIGTPRLCITGEIWMMKKGLIVLTN